MEPFFKKKKLKNHQVTMLALIQVFSKPLRKAAGSVFCLIVDIRVDNQINLLVCWANLTPVA
jgi:hypothetical protein